MNLISLFSRYIHPIFLRGRGQFHPHNTEIINENLSCVRQTDVNVWFYRKGNACVAIDGGYGLDSSFQQAMKQINLVNEDIDAVFLTHADLGTVGGLVSAEPFAPLADIYIHEEEADLFLNQGIRRNLLGRFPLKSPFSYGGDYEFFEDYDTYNIGGIMVKCFHVPGHTPGHCAFLVDDTYLFTGDAIAVNHYGGHCFFDLYNMDTAENIQSLLGLKEEIANTQAKFIATGHNGLCNIEAGFSNIQEVAVASRGNPFDPMAPYDVFRP